MRPLDKCMYACYTGSGDWWRYLMRTVGGRVASGGGCSLLLVFVLFVSACSKQ
ncbi:MAG: hypothetical protein LBP35_02980 [Candidatus Ancillula trichonymphae]|nr:hypothetical protein [Candidatus Ancillula trichonymphae]